MKTLHKMLHRELKTENVKYSLEDIEVWQLANIRISKRNKRGNKERKILEKNND